MPDVSLNGIEFRITGSADQASKSIEKLTASLTSLKSALNGVGNASTVKGAFASLADGIKHINEAVKGGTAKYEKFADAMTKVATAANSIGGGGDSLTTLANAMQTMQGVKVTATAFNNLASGVEKVAEASSKITAEAIANLEKMVDALSKLSGVDLKGLGSAMNAVRNGGAKALTATPLSAEMQEMISSASQVDILEAKLESLNDAMQRAFNAGDMDKAYGFRMQIIQTEAALEKARAAANSTASAIKEVGDSAKSTKKPLNTLIESLKRIAFYRMIRGAIKAVTQAFKEGLENAYQFSKGVGGDLAKSLDSISTKGLTMKNQLGAAFGGLLQALAPIILQIISLITRLASALSMIAAAFTGGTYLKAKDAWTAWGDAAAGAGGAAKKALEYLAPFDELNVLPDQSSGGGGGGNTPNYNDMFTEENLPPALQRLSDLAAKFEITVNDVLFNWGNLTGEQIAKKIISGIGGLLGAVTGFMFGGVPGAIIGTIAGVGITALLSSLIFDNDGVLSASEVKNMLKTAVNGLVGGVIGFVIGGPGGAILGASISLGLTTLVKAIKFTASGNDDIDKNGGVINDLVKALNRGVAMGLGASAGFVVGGPGGAVIGAVLGLGISLAIEKIDFATNENGEPVKKWNSPTEFLHDVIGLPYDQEIVDWVMQGINDIVNEVTRFFTGGTSMQEIVEALDEGWPLVEGWFKDLPTKLKSFGIKAINAFKTAIMNGMNKLIDEINNSGLAEFFGIHFDPIQFEMTPEIPESELTANYDAAKAALEAKSKESPVSITATAIFKTVKDSLTAAQKTIASKAEIASATVKDTVTAIITSKGKVASATVNSDVKPVITSTAGILDAVTSPSFVPPEINATAAVTDVKKDSNGRIKNEFATPIMSVMAQVTSTKNISNGRLSQAALSETPILGVKGQVTTVSDDIPESKKTFNLTGNWAYWGYGEGGSKSSSWWTTWNTTANFTKKKFDTSQGLKTDGDNLKIDATANITRATGRVNLNVTDVMNAKGGVFKSGVWSSIPQYAGGTARAHGSLFIAGEAGPEVVGHIGGRTEVLNRSQLAATMYSAVTSALASLRLVVSAPTATSASADGGDTESVLYRAFRRALDETDFGGDIELDGQTLYSAMVNRNRANTRMTGVNAFA